MLLLSTPGSNPPYPAYNAAVNQGTTTIHHSHNQEEAHSQGLVNVYQQYSMSTTPPQPRFHSQTPAQYSTGTRQPTHSGVLNSSTQDRTPHRSDSTSASVTSIGVATDVTVVGDVGSKRAGAGGSDRGKHSKGDNKKRKLQEDPQPLSRAEHRALDVKGMNTGQ